MARTPTVAILSAGDMGAAVGQRLAENGVSVITVLSGRGPQTAARARAAGFQIVDDDHALVEAADIVLSILPPDQALALARRLATPLRRSQTRPIYVDCNAVAPATAAKIGAVVEKAGACFVDGGIIGPPPRPDTRRTRIYVSGTKAAKVAALTQYGVDFRAIGGGIGAASALKMCYASLTKGAAALAIQAFTAARTYRVSEAFVAELRISQPETLAAAEHQGRGVGRKAYRWIGEMEEIAATFGAAGLPAEIFAGIADIYRLVDRGGGKKPAGDLAAVIARMPARRKKRGRR